MGDEIKWFIGIDGGGTGCRAVLSDALANVLSTAESGPSNIMTNFANAQNNLLQLVDQVMQNASIAPSEIDRTALVIGVAGANVGNNAQQLNSALPFTHCAIETDARVSLEGALGKADGVVVIIGTGSVFVSRVNGEYATKGGWGHIVSDTGSGAVLGKQLLREALLHHDNIHNGSSLTTRVLNQFNHQPESIVEFANSAEPFAFAEFAADIVDAARSKDSVALSLMRNAASDMEPIINAMLPGQTMPLCLLGKLGKCYAPYLPQTMQQRLVEPLNTAEYGALALALARFSNNKLKHNANEQH